jgi:hypothetical protein
MRIDSQGRLTHGSTGFASAGYSAHFKSSSSYTVAIEADSSDASFELLNLFHRATTGDNVWVVFKEGTTNARGTITYNRGGGVVAYNTTSDYRSKTILGELEDSGATIDAFKVYLGVMNGATVERPMLIAHEAQEVAPYCVTGEKDAVDDDGNPIYQQMDHQVLVPLLIAEIQQLRARVASLEAA